MGTVIESLPPGYMLYKQQLSRREKVFKPPYSRCKLDINTSTLATDLGLATVCLRKDSISCEVGKAVTFMQYKTCVLSVSQRAVWNIYF